MIKLHRQLATSWLIALLLSATLVTLANAFVRSVNTVANLPQKNSSLKFSVQGSVYIQVLGTNTPSTELTFVMSSLDNNWFSICDFVEAIPDVMLPMLSYNISDELCPSIAPYGKFTGRVVPCATLGFFNNNVSNMWLRVFQTNGNAVRFPLTGITFPFVCSDLLPCVARTPDPMDRSLGGCGGETTVHTDTLVVVTWNNSRYIFRPMRVFAGTGGFSVIPNSWPTETDSTLQYDAGLQFGVVRDVCVMKLISTNGTVDIFSIDIDDASSPTGLLRMTTVYPTSQQQLAAPATQQPCYPSVQFVTAPSSLGADTVLSVACLTGEGWLWGVELNNSEATLLGSYKMDPPAISSVRQPLVADISIVQIQAPQNVCNMSVGFLTAVALLGKGLYQRVPRLPDNNEDTNEIISFALFSSWAQGQAINSTITSATTISNNKNNTQWLTYSIINTSFAQGSYTDIDGNPQFLRNGLGWVVPTTVPATVVNASSADCTNITSEAINWLSAMIFYSAVSCDFNFLFRALDGTLAEPSDASIVNQTILDGGATFNGLNRIGTNTETFTRLPMSPTGVNVLLQTYSTGDDPDIHLLRSPQGVSLGILSSNATSQGPPATSSWLWLRTQRDPAALYYPSPVDLQYHLPLVSTAPPSAIQLVWSNDIPLFSTTNYSAQSSLLIIGSGLGDVKKSIGASYPYGRGKPGLYENELPPINAAVYPYMYICHGSAVMAYNSTVGDLLWTFDGLASLDLCESGSCGCDTSSVIYTSPFITVIFRDYQFEIEGVCILDPLNGQLISYISTNISDSDAQVSNECGPVYGFGSLIDLSDVIGATAISLPIFGSRCILIGGMSEGQPFRWGIFVNVESDVADGYIEDSALVFNSLLFLQEQTGWGYGRAVLSFDVTILWEVMTLNTQVDIYGANPTFILNNVLSYIVANGLIVVLEMSDNTTANPVCQMIRFVVYDGQAGGVLWGTQNVSICVFTAIGAPLSLLEPFIKFQASETGVVTLVCVGAYNLFCIIADEVPSEIIEFPGSDSCLGPPAASINNYLIWASEGNEPISIPLSTGNIGWVGINVPFPYELTVINQTSCQDAVAANDGLFLRCSLLGSNILRLFIVNAHTGFIMLGLGPKVIADGYSMSLDGERLTYLSEQLATVTTITFQTTNLLITVPLNAIGCGSDGEANYVLLNIGQEMGSIRTPFNTSENISTGVYTGHVTTFAAFAFTSTFSQSFDNSITLLGSESMLIALGTSLFPPVAQLLRLPAGIQLTAIDPMALTHQDGDTPLMAATSCLDCDVTCPQMCSLNIETGVQTQYTAKTQSIVWTHKPLGASEFNKSDISSQVIDYSGNVTLNLARFAAKLSSNEQTIQCYLANRTVPSPSGTFCSASGAQIWSVIELIEGKLSYASTFTLKTSNDYDAQRNFHFGYAAWTPYPVMSVMGELGLAPFLTNHTSVLPPSINKQRIQSVSSVILSPDAFQLTLVTGGSQLLVYDQQTCTNAIQLFPLCPQNVRLLSSVKIDKEIATIKWVNVAQSGWGIGFIATGYQVQLPQILRSPLDGTPVPCTTNENQNPLCTVVCQPRAGAISQMYSAFSSYLSLLSWLPEESTLFFNGNGNGSAEGFDAAGFVNPFVRFHTTVGGEVIMATDYLGQEVIVFSSQDHGPEVFGVQFTYSRCTFFTLSNVIALPFGWLVICAVKSLMLTFAFYVAEHRLRGIDRKRDALRDRMYRLTSQIDELRSGQQFSREQADDRESGSPPLLKKESDPRFANDDVDVTIRRRSTQYVHVQPSNPELEALEFELGQCAEAEQRFHSCGKTRSLVDRFISFITTLCLFRHPIERKGHKRRLRGNVLHKELDDDALVEMLLFVLKEERRYLHSVRDFALFYEWNLCNNKSWVVRQLPLEHSGSKRLSNEMADALGVVHSALRDVYKVFHADGTQPESLSSVDTTSSVQSNGFSDKDSKNTNSSNLAISTASTTRPESTFIDSEELRDVVQIFNDLHIRHPECFEYAVLSARLTDEQLQPSALLITLSLLESGATVLLYLIDVYIRSLSTPLTSLQIYGCVSFMIFNSSMPSSLMVNAFFHVNLSPGVGSMENLKDWALIILRNPFIIATLILFAPPLVTHVIPGMFLYGWLLIPPIVAAMFLEHRLRRKTHRPSRIFLAARVFSRIAILLITSIVFSIAFNVADGYIWKWVTGDEPYPTGTYQSTAYLRALEQDYDNRSMSCVWEYIATTISNFLQMGFFLV